MVEVFLVNYRTEKEVCPLLDLLLKNKITVRIWDNNNYQTKWNDELDVHQSGENIGFGRAVNNLSKFCRSDWFIVLNPDVQLAMNHYYAIVKELLIQEKDVALFSPRLVDESDRAHTLGYFPSYLSPFRHMMYKPKVLNDSTYITGAFMALRLDVFRALKGFDEKYFLYYEEVDFQKRLLKRGYERCLSDLKLVHNHGGSSSSFTERLIISDLSLKLYLSNHLSFPKFAFALIQVQRLNYLIRGVLSFREYWRYLKSL